MKLVKIIISVILIVIVVAVLGGWLYLRSLLPDVDGELKLAAIQDGVSIVRDSYGVPHIYSENRHDLYFAFGYTQAQDRLFQMDFYRRAAQGKL
ncbi:MAG: penicillin acylase family protein, partial [Desulfobacterales bacterium]|nr:penicillin acylase family protein [Desulfobacterales bacterium]